MIEDDTFLYVRQNVRGDRLKSTCHPDFLIMETIIDWYTSNFNKGKIVL